MEYEQIPPNSRRHFSKLTIVFGICTVVPLVLFVLVACSTSNDPEKSQNPVFPASNVADNPPVTMTLTIVPTTLTPIPTDTAQAIYRPTPDPLGKERFATAVAESDNQIATSVALTHAPRDTPGPPPIYPTETPVMGISSHCANTNSRAPQCYNFWRGVINGEIVEISAGSEGLDDDPSQGILMVSNWNTHAFDIYRTPQRAGAVEIVSVDGMRFTLVVISDPWTTATPGATFVFDLSTRQWVNP